MKEFLYIYSPLEAHARIMEEFYPCGIQHRGRKYRAAGSIDAFIREVKTTITDICRKQFFMSFAMLAKLPGLCPDELWYEKGKGAAFWHYIFHTLSGIHYWMRFKTQEYREPFPGIQLYPDFEDEPEQALSQQEIKSYCDTVQDACSAYFNTLNDSMLAEKSFLSDSFTNLDIVLLLIRHIQHHVGHCNAVLKENNLKIAEWLE